MNRQKKENRPWNRNRAVQREALPDRLSLPTGLLGNVTFLSLRGQECLELQGCLELLCYEEEHIAMRISEGELHIDGANLTLRTYHRCCITVGGKIVGLRFVEKETR